MQLPLYLPKLSAVLWVLGALSCCATDLRAAEIKLLGGSAVTPVMAELIPRFENSSGHKVIADLDGAIGAMSNRILSGETADVLIVSDEQIERLIEKSKVLNGTRVVLGKVGIGLFVKRGGRKPDISSVESFKRTLLASKSIGYNEPAAGAPVSIYLVGLFKHLGIAVELSYKTTAFQKRSERFDAVARGDVELGFNQISEIAAVPAVELVGPLPPEIQQYTVFAAGIVATTQDADAASEFLRFITSPQTRAVWLSKGFEPP